MKIMRNILAVVVGIVVCMSVNMALILIGHALIPPPAGFDPTDAQTMRSTAHLLRPQDFVMPFLAHALGSLAGGLVAAWIAASHKLLFALVIGGVHLLGGILMVMMLPAPIWFSTLDLLVAYLPMAWLGAKIVLSFKTKVANLAAG